MKDFKNLFFLALIMVLSFSIFAKDGDIPANVVSNSQDISHNTWDALLQAHVSSNGKVDYAGFAKDRAKLDSYLNLLQKNTPQSSWSEASRLAYWINAYNAFTVVLILDNYPLKSIKDIDKPWDRKFIKIGGVSYSLNDIEHGILRKKFSEPRIHFAVNCASKSCPPLLNQAFTASKVYSQLDQVARKFINNPSYNNLKADAPQISSIFDWYQEDFVKGQSLIEYLNKYAKTKVNTGAQVGYMAYDWNLNN